MTAKRGDARAQVSGRPPKFDEPRRPVTVTLPERILRKLGAIDGDRAKAIVKVTEMVAGRDDGGRPVELVEASPGRSLIVVGRSEVLHRIPWLELAEVSPGRHLLVLPSGTAVDSLEIALLDLVEHAREIASDERDLLVDLRELLGRLRRERRTSKAEIIFFDTRALRHQARKAPPRA
ncbi:MAG TPA: hypothetical protein VI078_02940 [bacterium]